MRNIIFRLQKNSSQTSLILSSDVSKKVILLMSFHADFLSHSIYKMLVLASDMIKDQSSKTKQYYYVLLKLQTIKPNSYIVEHSQIEYLQSETEFGIFPRVHRQSENMENNAYQVFRVTTLNFLFIKFSRGFKKTYVYNSLL